MVSLFADSCLFTPTNANYSLDYTLYMGLNGTENSKCSDKILSDNHTTTFELGFSDLEECGWQWTDEGNTLKVKPVNYVIFKIYLI